MTAQPLPQRAHAAFFDVDETLISVKSMFRFLTHFFRELGRPESAAMAVRADLASRAAAGASREETNRLCYQHLGGHEVTTVAATGESWFAGELATESRDQPRTGIATEHGREMVSITARGSSLSEGKPCLRSSSGVTSVIAASMTL